jgi:hypothetical protein
MNLKISISASSANVKRARYVAVIETEGLICDSETEQQCVSEDSDIEAAAAATLSDDSDNHVLTDHLWCDSRNEDRAELHHFSVPKPGVNCRAAPHISADSSPLGCFRLIFTYELLNIILTETNRYYLKHIQGH